MMWRPETFDPPWIDFFKRPCPAWKRRYQKFHLFPKLPKELQIMIWKFAKAEAQEVPFASFLFDEQVRARIKPPYQVPTLLHISPESRYEALKDYQEFESQLLRNPVYLDLKNDYLVLDWFAFEYIKITAPRDKRICRFLPEVRRLVIKADLGTNRGTTWRQLSEICAYFSRLEVLLIQEPNQDVNGNSRGREKLSFVDHVSIQRLPQSGFAITQIMDSITSVRERLEKWTMPCTCIGRMSNFQMESVLDKARKRSRGFMDWTPTFSFPTLEFVPKNRAVRNVVFCLEFEELRRPTRFEKEFKSSSGFLRLEGWTLMAKNYYDHQARKAKRLEQAAAAGQ